MKIMIEWELKWNVDVDVDVGCIIDDKCIISGIKEAEGIRQHMHMIEVGAQHLIFLELIQF